MASGFTNLLMGLLANYPFALPLGMGLNAYFTYTVVMQMGYPWQTALGVVSISGVIFLVLTFSKIRQIIVYAIPENIKIATAGGIGLFITLIGMEESKIIIDNPATSVSLGNIVSPLPLMTLSGVLITGVSMVRNVKGYILICMIITWGMGLLFELNSFKGIIGTPPDTSLVFLKLDIKGALDVRFF